MRACPPILLYLFCLLCPAAVLPLGGAEVVKAIAFADLGLPLAAKDDKLLIEDITVEGGEAAVDKEAATITVFIRLPVAGAVRGVVLARPPETPGKHALGTPDAAEVSEPKAYPFTISAAAFAAAPDGAERMAKQQTAYFLSLLGEEGRRGVLPTALDRGARAWWTLRSGQVDRAGAGAGAGRRHLDDLDQTIDLFSGLTALDENLQFDRALPATGATPGAAPAAEAPVETSSLPQLELREVPWARMPGAQAATPQLDLLAQRIPHDQYAVLFPSFAAMSSAIEQADRTLSGPLQLLAGHGEDALTKERYQRQLGLELSELARRFGELVIDRIALTGSDPFLRLGSDVAVLLHAKQPALLAGYLATRQQAQVAAGGVASDGMVGTFSYHAVVSPDRTLSSYVLIDGEVALVANSRAQLEAYAAVRAGSRPALAAAPEFGYFRQLYLQDGAELALAVISDATIRRWCSARWRIADARRTRAHAELCRLQAQWIAARCPAQWTPPAGDAGLEDLGALTISADGVHCARYGGLAFMTPLAESELPTVTSAEAAAYRRFLERYQRSWRDYLDPIAIRLQQAAPGRLAIDLSILPLIIASEYAEIFRLTGATTLAAGAADPHSAPFQAAIALDHKAGMLADTERQLGTVLGGLANPLSWVGDAASLYADGDPFWAEMAKSGKHNSSWFEEHISQLPLGISVGVRNPLKLAALLSSLRAFVEQSSPGLVSWSTRSWQDVPYVVVAPSGELLHSVKAELLYLAAPEGLTLTLSEAVMHHAIERLVARRAGSAPPPAPWAGEQLAAGIALPFLAQLCELDNNHTLESWVSDRISADIAILNEWHRLFPTEDPQRVHQRLWGTRLVCPLGGDYHWNDALLSMESTALGPPDHAHPPELWMPAAFVGIAGLKLGVGFTRLPEVAEAKPANGNARGRDPHDRATAIGLHTRVEIEAAPAAPAAPAPVPAAVP